MRRIVRRRPALITEKAEQALRFLQGHRPVAGLSQAFKKIARCIELGGFAFAHGRHETE